MRQLVHTNIPSVLIDNEADTTFTSSQAGKLLEAISEPLELYEPDEDYIFSPPFIEHLLDESRNVFGVADVYRIDQDVEGVLDARHWAGYIMSLILSEKAPELLKESAAMNKIVNAMGNDLSAYEPKIIINIVHFLDKSEAFIMTLNLQDKRAGKGEPLPAPLNVYHGLGAIASVSLHLRDVGDGNRSIQSIHKSVYELAKRFELLLRSYAMESKSNVQNTMGMPFSYPFKEDDKSFQLLSMLCYPFYTHRQMLIAFADVCEDNDFKAIVNILYQFVTSAGMLSKIAHKHQTGDCDLGNLIN